MSSYERASRAAREIQLTVPEFQAVAEASDRDRAKWVDEVRDARARARRWLLFAAALWLSLAVSGSVRNGLERADAAMLVQTLLEIVTLSSPILLLAWASRLAREPGFRAALLTRGIAASNLILALIFGLATPDPEHVLFAILLALAAGRSLQLLGELGLEGGEDPSSEFEPVKFRGILTLSLIMACTDAMYLLVNGVTMVALLVAGVLLGPAYAAPGIVPATMLNLGAAALMLVNVWGLSRLRIWALLSCMVANVAIASLALAGLLLTTPLMAALLATTAGIQLLLPLPILAAALGYPLPDRHDRVMTILLRVVVPALVLLTIVGALLPLEIYVNP